MKKIIVFAVSLIISFNLTIAHAETQEVNAGITPDSILYPIDKLVDEVKIALADDSQEKIEVITTVAEERLSEAQVMAEEGKEELTKTTVEEYQSKMDDAQSEFKTIIDNENQTTEVKSEEIDKIKEQIDAKYKKSIEVLTKIQEKVSENAKPTIQKVIELQTAKKEAVVNMVEKRHELNTARKALNEAEEMLKAAIESNNEDEIKKASELLNTAKSSFEAKKAELKSAMEAKKQVMKNKELKKEVKNTLKQEVKNGTITKQEAKEVRKMVNGNLENKEKNQERNKTEENNNSKNKKGKGKKFLDTINKNVVSE
ncbi:hypothetical protein ABG79_02045 [Caloramator mitchellensis]|uniref:DUF5667 domain-containing protein n=1 Tax=Caloramator mitchellensis TaxID=908809 RepID=A0A0R3JZ10_CALMK|nr:DUF5667 domain-containing protein [Caloramator mitchellensis]KRQ86204.1 hypothetical protein ABG79_02045 [Caloramator mitchellensis]